jgi:hypothetical protein
VTKVGAAASANLNVNASLASSGRVGLVLALPTGTTYLDGDHEILRATFVALNSVEGNYPVNLGDYPVWRAVSDDGAQELESAYVNAQVLVHPTPTLNISNVGTNVVLTWPSWAANFALQSADAASGSALIWSNTAFLGETNGGTVSVTLPRASLSKYFRLFHP